MRDFANGRRPVLVRLGGTTAGITGKERGRFQCWAWGMIEDSGLIEDFGMIKDFRLNVTALAGGHDMYCGRET